METFSKEIDAKEAEWLIKTAQQEYFYKEDRNKTFENNSGEGNK